MKRDPVTDAEWREAADAAVFALGLDSAWKYGLITPDPRVDVIRCEAILHLAQVRGIPIRTLEEVLQS